MATIAITCRAWAQPACQHLAIQVQQGNEAIQFRHVHYPGMIDVNVAGTRQVSPLRQKITLGDTLNPLPVQRPIPVWIGFGDPSTRTAAGLPLPRESALRRIARTADGWFPLFAPDAQGQETLERLRGYTREAGRDASTIGVEGRLSLTQGTPDAWAQEARAGLRSAPHI